MTERNLDYFYPHYTENQLLIQSAKLFVRKLVSETCAFITSLCCMKHAHYSKCMLHKQDCMTDCFENNFADFSDVVQVKKKKKSRFRPAIGGVSN